MSQQAEEGEPLLSRQLYDTLRKYNQDTAKGLRQTQDELLSRGQMSRAIYERLKDPTLAENGGLLDLTAALMREGMTPQAAESGQRARSGLDDLKRGVERAAESVLGDDTESLRLAQQELDRLMDQLGKEMTQAAGEGAGTNAAKPQAGRGGSPQAASTNRTAGGQQASTGRAGESASQPSEGAGQKPAETSEPNQANGTEGTQPRPDGQEPGSAKAEGSQASSASGTGGAKPQGDQAQAGGGSREGRPSDATPAGGARGSARDAGQRNQIARGRNSEGGGRGAMDFERLFEEGGGPVTGPITGDNFAGWSDRLRDVEEMVEAPELRNQVAQARDRARQLRQEFRRDLKKPDWAVVRLQVVKPLVEVRDRIAEELARRGTSEALVPIDRDPVPNRYSELVRRYYEALGK